LVLFENSVITERLFAELVIYSSDDSKIRKIFGWSLAIPRKAVVYSITKQVAFSKKKPDFSFIAIKKYPLQ